MTKKSLEEILTLPPQVPARLLFQVGPGGEDPIVDRVESKFRSQGLRVIQDKGSAVTLRAFSKDALKGGREDIDKWVSEIEVTRIELSQPPEYLIAKLESESKQYLHNMSWICSVDIKKNSDQCEVEITGRPEAVSAVADSVYQVIVVTGGVAMDGVKELKFILKKNNENYEEKKFPEYRFFRDLKLREKSEDLKVPQIPLSVFDRFSPSPPAQNYDFQIFKNAMKIEKSDSIPIQVINRLEEAVGLGTKITQLDNCVVDIRCSSSEDDVAFAEQLVRACASRTGQKNSDWTALIPMPPRSIRLRPVEQHRRVVCVESGKQLLIIGRPVAVSCACADLGKPRTEGDKQLGEKIKKIGKESGLMMKRGQQCAGDNVAVNLIGSELYITADSAEKREFVIGLLNHFLNGEFSTKIKEKMILFPVRGVNPRMVAEIEQQFGVLITKTEAPVGDLAIKCRESKFETIAVFGWNFRLLISAIIHMIDSDSTFYDLASLKFALAGGFVSGLVSKTIPDVDLADIEKAMSVTCKSFQKEDFIIIGGDEREAVLLASDLVSHKPIAWSKFKLSVKSNSVDLARIASELGVVATRSNENVDIYSVYPIRRAAGELVLTRQKSLTQLTQGWNRAEVKKSKSRQRKKDRAMSDSDYEFGHPVE